MFLPVAKGFEFLGFPDKKPVTGLGPVTGNAIDFEIRLRGLSCG